MSFLNFSWQTYLIAFLLTALVVTGLVLKHEAEKAGKLSVELDQLTQQIQEQEKENKRLSLSLQNSESRTVEDVKERDALKIQVSALNKKVSQLSQFTKGNKDERVTTDSDDVMLSDELISLLKQSYCSADKDLCPNPQTSPK